MTHAGYNMGALEDCRSTVDGKAGPVGAIGDGFEGHPGLESMAGGGGYQGY